MSTAQLIKKWTWAFHLETRVSRSVELPEVKVEPASEVSLELGRLRSLGYHIAVRQLEGRRLAFQATDERTGEDHVAVAESSTLAAQQSAMAILTEKVASELEG